MQPFLFIDAIFRHIPIYLVESEIKQKVRFMTVPLILKRLRLNLNNFNLQEIGGMGCGGFFVVLFLRLSAAS
jgi:hypothetical protein